MNERIRELAKQAGITIKDLGRGLFVADDVLLGDLEQFAELILEECAKRAEAYAYMSDNFNALAQEIREMKL